MRTAYFIVSIPDGEHFVTAATTNGQKLEYLDFFDRALLYRYFAPGSISIRRITAREARKRRERPASFRDLFRLGHWQ
ncbi:MAG: hypothetical protein IJK99_09370 [Bacteroidales bacterium]|nr:hypothetical protein [Bacteroidales bacterium]